MLECNFTPFPVLATERLLLRQTVPEDVNEIFFFRSDPGILQYINKEPIQFPEQALQFIQMITDNLTANTGVSWGITWKEQPAKIIGTIALWRIEKEHYRAEIGYTLHPLYQKKGIMDEALKAVIHYGFSIMGLHSIEANINPENVASRKLLEQNGFVQEGYFRENFYFQGAFYDSATFSLLASQVKEN
jgi:ribosomal-protein-alanine N-acetyltransferase